VLAASSGKDSLCGGSAMELMIDGAHDLSSASTVSMDFLKSSFVQVRSDVSNRCLSPASQPLASVSVLLVDNASSLVSMTSASKVIHEEATTSTSPFDWSFGTDSDVEGEDYLWEGDEVFPQAQKQGDDAGVAMFLSSAWSFTQALDGMSWVPPKEGGFRF
jgi:hypothetical protein